jgi:excisionase family DNA binding protein
MSSAVELNPLTIEEAAPRLRIAPKTLRKWLRAGEFPGVKVGRKWLVREADVEHALTHGRRGGQVAGDDEEDAGRDTPAPVPDDEEGV